MPLKSSRLKEHKKSILNWVRLIVVVQHFPKKVTDIEVKTFLVAYTLQ